jgi:LEA14-like dessication related protein
MHRLRSSIRRVILPAALCVPLGGCTLVAHVTTRFESPVIELEASKVESISQAGARLLFELVAHNPNSYALRLRALRVRLTVNHTVVAESQADASLAVPSHATASVHLPIDVRLTKLLDVAPGAMMVGEIPYDLEVQFAVDSWLHQRQVVLTTSSVLRLNLPIGLARAAVVALHATGWQT